MKSVFICYVPHRDSCTSRSRFAAGDQRKKKVKIIAGKKSVTDSPVLDERPFFSFSDCLAAKYLLGSGHNHSIIRKLV